MDQISGWRRYLLVQPPVMLLLFSLSMSVTILQDLILYRTCTTILKINETECLMFHSNSSSKEALRINSMVQPYASLIVMGKAFIESISPAFLLLFLGPWSDKYGRKPLMLSGYISTSLTYLLLSIMASWDVVPWYFLIAYIPTALLGGISVLMLGSTCYITDITDDNERAWHLALLEALMSLGILSGLLSGPVIFEACGYTAVFSVATAFCILATLYTLLLVPETIHSQTSGIHKVFDLELIKDLINTCIRKRDGFNRSLVWTCITCLTILLIVFEGNLAIGYMFTNARLGWTMEKYNTYVAMDIIVGVVGTISGIKLMRKYAGIVLKTLNIIKTSKYFIICCNNKSRTYEIYFYDLGFPETIVAIISVTSSFSNVLVRALTWQSWHMYLSLVLGMFGDISRSMIRAILSKAVPLQDTGKVFSLATALETLLPFAAASLYSFLYSYYMPPLYPQPVWFLSALFYFITIVILICMQTQMIGNTTVPFTPLMEDSLID